MTATGVPFSVTFEVRWSDLDANRHVRNTIFSELATHTRFRFLDISGFPDSEFGVRRIGPVMFREDVRYRRELLLGDTVTVNLRAAGLSEDGSHWRVYQEVWRSDGREAANLTIDGAWIHLDTRRLVLPPAELLQVFGTLARTPDCEELRSVIRSVSGA